MGEEIWRPVVGYEGLYEVSSHGNVRGLARILPNGVFIDGYIKSFRLKGGYRQITLKNRGAKYYLVHRLVAHTFIPNMFNHPQINHKDGNKLNNHASNLEWCTSRENIMHAYRTGLKKSCKKGFKKSPVFNIDSGIIFPSLKLAHIHFGKYHFTYFCDMVSGRRKNTTNYVTMKSLEKVNKEREESDLPKNACSQLIINGLG